MAYEGMDKKDKWQISASSLSHLKDPDYQKKLKENATAKKQRWRGLFVRQNTAIGTPKVTPKRKVIQPKPAQSKADKPNIAPPKIIKPNIKPKTKTPTKAQKIRKPLPPFLQKYYWLGVFLLPIFLVVVVVSVMVLPMSILSGSGWALAKNLAFLLVGALGIWLFGRTH